MSTQTKSLQEFSINHHLIELWHKLIDVEEMGKKILLLENFGAVRNFFSDHPLIENLFSSYENEERIVLLSLLAIGQGKWLFKSLRDSRELSHLLQGLVPVEKFYEKIGGIIGYHLTCIRLLVQKDVHEKKGIYHSPKAREISEETDAVRKNIIDGILSLDALAEMYPIGGAADRLSLHNEENGFFQIAATFEFCERTLLQRLIDDLQAREFLYYKLFHRQIYIPVVVMTSDEKRGDDQVRQMFKEKHWFGRREEDLFIFSQPLVPTMNKEGRWCMLGPTELLFKPGGHGVLWKLAQEFGALNWLKKMGKKKTLVRQINNVIAGVDYGLLAFMGIGFSENKDFGFAACPRIKGVSEGVNVVIENDKGLCLTNIEYCDIEHFQVDEKREPLLANTNLLLVDIETIEEILPLCPIPGMLVNAKKVKYKDSEGQVKEDEILRLESTMQNLADALIEPNEPKRSFITSNQRRKTISPIKKEFAFGSSMLQTPEQCYLDVLENARDLLVNYCQFQVPELRDPMNFFQNGPSFIFLYHPSLGPLYHIIAQKLRGGRLAMGSELKFHIAELYIENLDVDGSLHIETDALMGHYEEGILHYSKQLGKCILKNVKVRNSGINLEASRSFWKEEIVHREKCEILIEEGGEFHASDVTFRGDLCIHVPSGVKVTASMNKGKLELLHEVLLKPSWQWQYAIDSENWIQLVMTS